MSNSPLVDCVCLSPNNSGIRKHRINTITPHVVVGQLSAESIGGCFSSRSVGASCNYGIGAEGRIVLVVNENEHSWCSSNFANDDKAVTIECACDESHPYALNSVVYNRLVDLCTDICIRNGIEKLLWFNDRSKTLNYTPASNEAVITVHRWFKNKACPGDWLYSRLGDLASRVTARLSGASGPSVDMYRVQTGAFASKANADALKERVKEAGFDAFVNYTDGMYKVQVGAYKVKNNAELCKDLLTNAGFEAFITGSSSSQAQPAPPAPPAPPATIKLGSRVRVARGAKTYTGGRVASFVYDRTYTVDYLRGDRAVLDSKGLCTPFNIDDLILA